MPTLGFRIDSIRAERYNFDPIPQLNINMNIMLSRPTKKDNSYVVEFVVKLDCTPPIASINIKGLAFITPINPEEAKRLDEDLSKHTPPQPLVLTVYGYTLPVIALLSRELGLPPPVQIPMYAEGKADAERSLDYHM